MTDPTHLHIHYPQRARPALLAWLHHLDSYGNETYGRPVGQVIEARQCACCGAEVDLGSESQEREYQRRGLCATCWKKETVVDQGDPAEIIRASVRFRKGHQPGRGK